MSSKVFSFPPPNPLGDADVRGAMNLITIQLSGPASSAVAGETTMVSTVAQLQAALGLLQLNDIVFQSLSADMNDPNFIRFTKGTVVVLGDELSKKIQSIISFSDAQMTALFTSAISQSL